MTETPLSRWSRLKREARAREAARPPEETPPPPEAADPAEDLPDLDLESLPPVESLSAESDFRIFLHPKVPAALRNAALRRLWVADPAIRDMEILADYDWDFNASGYGALLPTDDVKALAERVLRTVTEPAPTDPPAVAETTPQIDADPKTPEHPVQGSTTETLALSAPTEAPEPEPLPEPPTPDQTDSLTDDPAPDPVRRPRHGGAIPV